MYNKPNKLRHWSLKANIEDLMILHRPTLFTFERSSDLSRPNVNLSRKAYEFLFYYLLQATQYIGPTTLQSLHYYHPAKLLGYVATLKTCHN